jgi:hypothetical protein
MCRELGLTTGSFDDLGSMPIRDEPGDAGNDQDDSGRDAPDDAISKRHPSTISTVEPQVRSRQTITAAQGSSN